MTLRERAPGDGPAPDVMIQGLLPNAAYVVLIRQAGQYLSVRRGDLTPAQTTTIAQAEAAFKQGTPQGDRTAIAILVEAGFAVERVE